MNLCKAGTEGEAAHNAEAQNLYVIRQGIEGRWAMKEEPILPRERPSVTDRCNNDTESLKRSRDVTVTNRGSADEVVVVVKTRSR